MALTRKPRRGDKIRWPHWAHGRWAVVERVDDTLCYIREGDVVQPFIWLFPRENAMNALAEIVDDDRPRWPRVELIDDHRGADKRLIVQKGARGTVTSYNGGYCGVLFDDGQNLLITPDGGGRLHQDVPVLSTREVEP